MKITKQDIKEFVESHLGVEDISVNKYTLSTHRSYFYYLCYKYSTDVVNTIELFQFLGLGSHGTVLNGLKNIENLYQVDKRYRYELENIEREFLKKFKVHPAISEIADLSKLQIKRRLIKYEMDNKRLKNSLEWYKRQNEKMRKILNETLKNNR